MAAHTCRMWTDICGAQPRDKHNRDNFAFAQGLQQLEGRLAGRPFSLHIL